MNFKLNKRLIVIVCAFICLLLTIMLIQVTYARYVTSLTTKSYVELGSWLLLINDQNVTENADFSAQITPVIINDSEYIADDQIVPTSKGYVEFTINYSDVTVPFKYDIYLSPDTSTNLEDFTLTSYSIDNNEITYDKENPIISHEIIPDGIINTQTIKLNYTWNDNEEESFDDIKDTSFARNYDDLLCSLIVNFTQLKPAEI